MAAERRARPITARDGREAVDCDRSPCLARREANRVGMFCEREAEHPRDRPRVAGLPGHTCIRLLQRASTAGCRSRAGTRTRDVATGVPQPRRKCRCQSQPKSARVFRGGEAGVRISRGSLRRPGHSDHLRHHRPVAGARTALSALNSESADEWLAVIQEQHEMWTVIQGRWRVSTGENQICLRLAETPGVFLSKGVSTCGHSCRGVSPI